MFFLGKMSDICLTSKNDFTGGPVKCNSNSFATISLSCSGGFSGFMFKKPQNSSKKYSFLREEVTCEKWRKSGNFAITRSNRYFLPVVSKTFRPAIVAAVAPSTAAFAQTKTPQPHEFLISWFEEFRLIAMPMLSLPILFPEIPLVLIIAGSAVAAFVIVSINERYRLEAVATTPLPATEGYVPKVTAKPAVHINTEALENSHSRGSLVNINSSRCGSSVNINSSSRAVQNKKKNSSNRGSSVNINSYCGGSSGNSYSYSGGSSGHFKSVNINCGGLLVHINKSVNIDSSSGGSSVHIKSVNINCGGSSVHINKSVNINSSGGGSSVHTKSVNINSSSGGCSVNINSVNINSSSGGSSVSMNSVNINSSSGCSSVNNSCTQWIFSEH